jgi:hypothetical protein
MTRDDRLGSHQLKCVDDSVSRYGTRTSCAAAAYTLEPESFWHVDECFLLVRVGASPESTWRLPDSVYCSLFLLSHPYEDIWVCLAVACRLSVSQIPAVVRSKRGSDSSRQERHTSMYRCHVCAASPKHRRPRFVVIGAASRTQKQRRGQSLCVWWAGRVGAPTNTLFPLVSTWVEDPICCVTASRTMQGVSGLVRLLGQPACLPALASLPPRTLEHNPPYLCRRRRRRKRRRKRRMNCIHVFEHAHTH